MKTVPRSELFYKLQREVDNSLGSCNNGFERDNAIVFLEQDLRKYGYSINKYGYLQDISSKESKSTQPELRSLLMKDFTNVAVKDIGKYIINRDTFCTPPRTIYTKNGAKQEASSVFSRMHHEDTNPENGASLYIVYSYGYHFPLVIYDFTCERWYMNMDEYSRTTSKHQFIIRQSFAKHHMSAIASDTEEMSGIDNYGSTAHWVMHKAS